MQIVYKFFTSTQGDAAASIDIPEDGVIEGVLAAMDITGADVLNDGYRWELSFASTSGFSSNDTRASIAGGGVRTEVVTTGGSIGLMGLYVPMEVSVQGGERLYLHTVAAGTIAQNLSVWVYVRHANVAGRASAARRPNFR